MRSVTVRTVVCLRHRYSELFQGADALEILAELSGNGDADNALRKTMAFLDAYVARTTKQAIHSKQEVLWRVQIGKDSI